MTTELKRLFAALAVCAASTLVELAGGFGTRSLALSAEGLHSLIHVGAFVIAIWGAFRAVTRGAAAQAEAAAVNALVILALAVLLAIESISRFGSGEEVRYGAAIGITLFGLLANGATVIAMGWGEEGDLNHRAALLHMLGDAGVGVLALAGLGLGVLFGIRWADAAAGLIGAGVLGVIAGRLLQRTLGHHSPAASSPEPSVRS